MKRIVLVCSQGASTSMLMARMQSAADAAGYKCVVEAHPVDEAAEYTDADVVLLGPQVRFRLDEVRGLVSCPVEAIDMTSYGTMNGGAVLALARKLMGDE